MLEFARRVVSLDHMLTGGRGNSKIIVCRDGSLTVYWAELSSGEFYGGFVMGLFVVVADVDAVSLVVDVVFSV